MPRVNLVSDWKFFIIVKYFNQFNIQYFLSIYLFIFIKIYFNSSLNIIFYVSKPSIHHLSINISIFFQIEIYNYTLYFSTIIRLNFILLGHTSIVLASHGSHTEIVKLLLENGADIEAKDFFG